MANGLARKLFKGDQPTVCGFSYEDLASEAIVHFLLKLKAGKFKKYPAADMWKVIRKCMWHRMLDIVSRSSNKKEVQAPERPDDDEPVESDQALELIDGGKGGMWGSRWGSRRSEIQESEQFVDSILNRLPKPMSILIKLRFGLWRDDECGSEFPVMDEPLRLRALAEAGFGKHQVEVSRRVKDALERFRELAIADLSRWQTQ